MFFFVLFFCFLIICLCILFFSLDLFLIIFNNFNYDFIILNSCHKKKAKVASKTLKESDKQAYNDLMFALRDVSSEEALTIVKEKLRIRSKGNRTSKKTWEKWVPLKRFTAWLRNTMGEHEEDIPSIIQKVNAGKHKIYSCRSHAVRIKGKKKKVNEYHITDSWEESENYDDVQDFDSDVSLVLLNYYFLKFVIIIIYI